MNYFNLIALLIVCTSQSEAYSGSLIVNKVRISNSQLYSSNERSSEPKKWQVGNKGSDMSKSKEDRGAAGVYVCIIDYYHYHYSFLQLK
jgi:hypothetical protein